MANFIEISIEGKFMQVTISGLEKELVRLFFNRTTGPLTANIIVVASQGVCVALIL